MVKLSETLVHKVLTAPLRISAKQTVKVLVGTFNKKRQNCEYCENSRKISLTGLED